MVTDLSATTSVKSRIMALPGACLPTRGSQAQGAREASSFSTRDIFLFLGSGTCWLARCHLLFSFIFFTPFGGECFYGSRWRLVVAVGYGVRECGERLGRGAVVQRGKERWGYKHGVDARSRARVIIAGCGSDDPPRGCDAEEGERVDDGQMREAQLRSLLSVLGSLCK